MKYYTENINALMLLSPIEDSLNIEEVNNAKLANPVMVKEEIVEFMKYRAPTQLVGTLDTLRDKLEEYTKALDEWERTANEYADCDSDLIQ